MTGQVLYNFGAVSSTGAAACSFSSQMRSIFDDMLAKVKATAGDAWTGEAQRQWEAEQAKWNREADELGNAYHRAGVVTQNCAEGMRATDIRAAAGMTSSGAGRYGGGPRYV